MPAFTAPRSSVTFTFQVEKKHTIATSSHVHSLPPFLLLLLHLLCYTLSLFFTLREEVKQLVLCLDDIIRIDSRFSNIHFLDFSLFLLYEILPFLLDPLVLASFHLPLIFSSRPIRFCVLSQPFNLFPLTDHHFIHRYEFSFKSLIPFSFRRSSSLNRILFSHLSSFLVSIRSHSFISSS